MYRPPIGPVSAIERAIVCMRKYPCTRRRHAIASADFEGFLHTATSGAAPGFFYARCARNQVDRRSSPALVEARLTETFAGDIEGESPVRALQVLRDDKSACLVSMQRFRGRLGGRHGTFVLQGSEIVENGKIKATWLPGSGTGGLCGLRGEGGFEGEFGRGSDGTLDY